VSRTDKFGHQLDLTNDGDLALYLHGSYVAGISADVVALDIVEAMRQRDLGIELVLERRSAYRSKVEDAIASLAASGREFGSDDVRTIAGDPPRGVSTNLTGALFIAASKAGLIRPVGFGYSARVVGHHNLTRRWVGVRQ
jgi:hypothetical protein